MTRFPHHRARAFTLVELLVVIGITAALIFATVPALPSLLGNRGMSKAVTETWNLLELSRNHALTSSQPTFVAFQNTKTLDGEDALTAFAFSSLVTRPSISPSTKQLNDIQVLSNIHRWTGVKLAEWDKLDAELKKLRFARADSKSLASAPGLNVSIGNLVPEPAWLFTIMFSPQGKAMIYSSFTTTDGKNTYTPDIDLNTPYDRFIDLVLLPTRGGNVDSNNPDQAALVLNGASGHIQILRP
jgi:type II secretory pathway pseudopilin PulG